MPLPNPFEIGFKRADQVIETRSFVAKVNGEEIEVPFTLRGLDEADDYVVEDQAFNATAAYTAADGGMPSRLVQLDGKPVAMSFQLCRTVAAINVAQVGAERYDFEQLCAWLVILGDQWGHLVKWANELNEKARGKGKPSQTA